MDYLKHIIIQTYTLNLLKKTNFYCITSIILDISQKDKLVFICHDNCCPL